MAKVRIPLVGSLVSRDGTNAGLFSSSQKDQYFEDCVFHVTQNAFSGKTLVKVGPRKVFAETASPAGASGHGTAIQIWRGKSASTITAFGSTNSTIYNNDSSLGAITGRCIHISETMISSVPTLVFVSDSNLAYYYVDAGSLTEITDTDFPPKQTPALTLTGNFAHMDGFGFVMCTNGQIWHSDVNTLVNWTSTAAITAQEYPDLGVGVARHRNFIVGFSRYSIEFFINAGNQAGAVLQRVQSMAKQIGAVNRYCISPVEDTLAFVGSHLHTVGVYILSDGNPKKISTQAVDLWILAQVIAAGGDTAGLRLHIIADHNRYYIAVSSSSNATNVYAYDLTTGAWQPWTLEYGIRQSDASGGGTVYVGQDSTKQLSNLGNAPASGTIQTQPMDFDSRKYKTLNSLRVIGDKATSTSTLTISWSDDDGQTWSAGRTVDMASNDPRLLRAGLFKRRAFRITGLSAAATGRDQLLEAIELEVTEGAI